jgi:branched-subunit amino acid ABC-type transport system permease component
MLGLFLLYFIGKYFYKLAETYQSNKWLFAVLGVASYYAGTFVGGLILGVLDVYLEFEINWENSATNFIFLPFGLLSAYLFYYLLKRNWSKKQEEEVLSIEDIGKDTVD